MKRQNGAALTQNEPEAKIDVVFRRLKDLKPDPRNPRRHSPRQIDKIAESIRSFGFNVPVLIDSSDRVVAGHGRLLACMKLGWEEVPTIALGHLNDAQVTAFRIADNRLTELGAWDDQILGQLFKELSELDLNFSLEATGFEVPEIDLRIEGLVCPGKAGDAADLLPEVPSNVPISRLGDVWVLGRHRLLCGNALEPSCYQTLLAGRKADAVFTDMPYNVPIDGFTGGLGKIHHRDFAMACGEMSNTEFSAFLGKAMSLAATHSRNGALHYLFMDWRHAGEMLTAGQRIYNELKAICVWVKSTAGMGSFYRSQHELIFIFKFGDGPHRNNIQLGKYGRHRSNTWFYPGIASFGRDKIEGNLLALHPTIKPTALVADALLDCTARGGMVMDPFLGSGTTILAAERTGRVAYGMEIDPIYVDVSIQRWQQLTGEAALHAETGRSFEEITAEREDACSGRRTGEGAVKAGVPHA